MSSAKIYKPRPISGYPEWLPEVRAVELQWLDTLRRVFEQYGYCSIETPAVEELAVLAAKGETSDKEIYTLSRLNAEVEEAKESRLGLHYDLTVPLARYVAQHFSHLAFPFKRYQMQKVWRGERPQEGRFREFYQCDIDVLAPEHLSLEFDIEVPLVMSHALRELEVGGITINLSNRKILQGYLEGLGISDATLVIREIDKLDKVGQENVLRTLVDELSLTSEIANKALAIACIKSSELDFAAQVEQLGVQSELLSQGIDELSYVFSRLKQKSSSFVVNLGIARGFDYYTGTILEATLDEFPDFNTIAAGGRYDNLASSYTNQTLPGIGISIGLSRLFAKMHSEGKIDTSKKSPTQILVTWPTEELKERSSDIATLLRERGFNVELYHAADKLKKQIKYADKKGIPFVWFPESSANDQVKNMNSGEQVQADAQTWEP